ncbi:MAG: 1-acyl-sn-glycerol-3-phosphate acyltransferase [Candidatus Woesearchaeota archaeon]
MNQSKRFERELEVIDEVVKGFDDSWYSEQEGLIREKLSHFVDDVVVEGFQRDRLEGNTVVYLPRHLSHVDYIALALKLHDLRMPPPVFAAGSNLFIGRFGDYLKRGKAVPINRRLMGSPGYVFQVIKRFVNFVAEGEDTGIYTEGGRSYDGQIEQLNPLFFGMTERAQEKAGDMAEDIVLQPIAESYDWVPESEIFHLLSKTRGLRNYGYSLIKRLGDLAYYGLDLTVFAPRYFLSNPEGSLYLSFGQPKTVRELKIEAAAHEPKIRYADHARNYVRAELIKHQRVTPTALVAFCIEEQGTPRDVDRMELGDRVELYAHMLVSQGFKLSIYFDGIRDPFGAGVDIFQRNGVLNARNGSIKVRNPHVVRYYANTIREVMETSREICLRDSRH